jgi:hypothetical protein
MNWFQLEQIDRRTIEHRTAASLCTGGLESTTSTNILFALALNKICCLLWRLTKYIAF